LPQAGSLCQDWVSCGNWSAVDNCRNVVRTFGERVCEVALSFYLILYEYLGLELMLKSDLVLIKVRICTSSRPETPSE